MINGVIFIGLPLCVYIVMVLLPEGRAAVTGVAAAGFLALLGWGARAIPLAPAFSGDAASDGLLTAALAMATGAFLLGAVVQFVRTRLSGDRPDWLYPAFAGGTAIVAGVPVLNLLGV